MRRFLACWMLALLCSAMAPAWAQVTVEYIHTDALGSPVAVTNASGQVIERTEYEPYGAAIGKTVSGVGYTGHVMDAATGLTYMQQRYYDQQLGVFLSVDPVTAYEQPISQFHRYRYANGNPYRFIDPDGRKPGDPFDTNAQAAKDAIRFINPASKRENREYGGLTYKGGDGKYRATNPVKGSEDGVNPHDSPIPEGAQLVGDYHTHGEYSQVDSRGNIIATGDPKRDDFNSDNFSEQDKSGIAADAVGKVEYRGYLGTPSGVIREYNPITKEDRELK